MANPQTHLARHLAELRRQPPLVHAITNYVAMDLSANALLAAGAVPAMVHAEAEAAEFAGIADALVVNIGTLSPPWVRAMAAAAEAAVAAGRPWVLDPVAAGATAYRSTTALRLLALAPTVLRGNASEILALAGTGGAGRGPDSADPVDEAETAARTLAAAHGCVVAVTGARDFVTDGRAALRIANGHPMMTKVTALGCALSALVAAFVARAPGEALAATAAALAFVGVAGERAAATSAGPGSFRVAFLDALAAVDGPGLAAAARISPA
ncbi:MAG: hydroxyethylthiazole kinase [Rhodospirillaceae bacterium]|nr:hydroxyethylthiazole kinase [Rhodospirillaceae bacterium]